MTEPITFGSLFAGIGGFDLGFERAGMSCKWQVEIDDYGTRVLEKHWPEVHRERDIRECGRHNLERVDVICGGFPCQDISYAGRGAGLDGERSGLFFEAIRVVCELRPRVVVLENVAALLTRGLDRVLGTLAEIGYDAEWHCIPAAAVGAPHIRDRVFVLAYADTDGSGQRCNDIKNEKWSSSEDRRAGISTGRDVARADVESASEVPNSNSGRQQVSEECHGESLGRSKETEQRNNADRLRDDVADAGRLQQSRRGTVPGEAESGRAFSQPAGCGWWATEPAVCRISEGLSETLDGGGLDVDQRWIQVSRSEITWRLLRELWNNGQLERTPQGRGFGEQFAGEYPDIVRQLSHETPLEGRQKTVEEIRRCLCRLRQGVDSWDVRNSSNTIEAAWRSASQETKDWFRLGACGRTYWQAGEWPGVPRLATGVPARVDRLRGLGNAVVPQVAEYVGRMVMERINEC